MAEQRAVDLEALRQRFPDYNLYPNDAQHALLSFYGRPDSNHGHIGVCGREHHDFLLTNQGVGQYELAAPWASRVLFWTSTHKQLGDVVGFPNHVRKAAIQPSVMSSFLGFFDANSYGWKPRRGVPLPVPSKEEQLSHAEAICSHPQFQRFRAIIVAGRRGRPMYEFFYQALIERLAGRRIPYVETDFFGRGTQATRLREQLSYATVLPVFTQVVRDWAKHYNLG